MSAGFLRSDSRVWDLLTDKRIRVEMSDGRESAGMALPSPEQQSSPVLFKVDIAPFAHMGTLGRRGLGVRWKEGGERDGHPVLLEW